MSYHAGKIRDLCDEALVFLGCGEFTFCEVETFSNSLELLLRNIVVQIGFIGEE